jgi:RNA polymerase sigma-70 factor (ECF subfamily)
MELINRCQEGDPNAFALLFEQYKNLVYRTALLMLDDSEEAEDVLQEVFLRVHRSLNTYQPEKGAFTTWLHRITVNYCLNLRRRRIFDLIPWDTASNSDARWKYPSAEDQADQGDMHRNLQKLSPKLRAVIVLQFYWSLTYAEISQVLDIPIGTVQSRLNQALKNLRHSMRITPNGDLAVSREEEASS